MFFNKKKKRKSDIPSGKDEKWRDVTEEISGMFCLKYIHVICRDNIKLKHAQEIILQEVTKSMIQNGVDPAYLFDKEIAWKAAYPESLVKDYTLLDIAVANIIMLENKEKIKGIEFWKQHTGEYNGCEYLIIATDNESLKQFDNLIRTEISDDGKMRFKPL
jgi:hypothetical protein